ncbi:MAG TPA: hypothetical protein VHV47_06350, partial [Opitutaceae bacterium]|nr:hypothetical protein [Opitutaceae bacterium]
MHLPPYQVTVPQGTNGFLIAWDKLNHAFDGPFPELRSGPMVEAILWRHRYLADHPNEKAVIVTTSAGARIRSATTLYSLGGRVYASSLALGEHYLLKGLAPADLADPAKIDDFRATVQGIRNAYFPAGRRPADAAYLHTAAGADALGLDQSGLSEGGAPVLGTLLVAAEETGDYSVLAQMGDGDPWLQMAYMMPFTEAAPEVLGWTYRTLHNPDAAGIVPAALSRIHLQDAQTGQPISLQALV